MESEEKLSALDAAFLYFEMPDQPLIVSCLAELEESLSYEDFVELIETRLAAVPRLRQVPHRHPLDTEIPVWKDDLRFDLARHVQTASWRDPGDTPALRDTVEDLVSVPLLEDGHPLWRAVLIKSENGECAVLFCAHHCMLDGVGGARLLERLSDPIMEEAEPRTKSTGPTPLPRESSADTSPIWDRIKDIAEIASTFVSLLHEQRAPTTSFNAALSARRRMCWVTLPWHDIASIRTASGCTANDVALSIIAGGLRRYIRRRDRSGIREPLRSVVPVSTRRDREELSLGNAFSAMFPSLPIHIADPLERLRMMAQETRSLKQRGQAQAMAFLIGTLENLPNAVGAALPNLLPDSPVFNTICTNIPGSREPRTLAGARIKALHGAVPLFQSMGIEFAVMNHGKAYSICAHIDPEQVPDEEILIDALKKSFLDLRRAHRRVLREVREIEEMAEERRPNVRYPRDGTLSAAIRMMADAQAAEQKHRQRNDRG